MVSNIIIINKSIDNTSQRLQYTFFRAMHMQYKYELINVNNWS